MLASNSAPAQAKTVLLLTTSLFSSNDFELAHSWLNPKNPPKTRKTRFIKNTMFFLNRARTRCFSQGTTFLQVLEALGSDTMEPTRQSLLEDNAPGSLTQVPGQLVDGRESEHRCPFWLVCLKDRRPWCTWWFSHLPGPSIFQKGHL